MKIAEMSPLVTEWKMARNRKVGAWSFIDHSSLVNGEWIECRSVYHYRMCMAQFTYTMNGTRGWEVTYTSVGHGSVSDQGGMNKLLAEFGYKYRRDRKGGGPRVVRYVTAVEAW